MNSFRFMALLAILAPASAAGAAYNADYPPLLSCRTQVIAHCNAGCAFGGGPADLSFDFNKGMINYCRGEQCDAGKITLETNKGQWDDQTYLLFSGKIDRGGKVWGVISVKPMTFYANGDAGDMFGNCATD